MEMEGIVSSVRRSASGSASCTIMCPAEGKVVTGECGIAVKLYDRVEVEYKGAPDESGVSLDLKVVGEATRGHYDKARNSLIETALEYGGGVPALGIQEFDRFAKAEEGEFKEAARRLAASIISGSPVIVRYHNDGDGASGAVALFRSVSEIQKQLLLGKANVTWKVNKGVSYSSSSHWSDMLLFNSYESAEMPLVVIIDFGTTAESEQAIANPRGVEFIWIDHHPIPAGFPKDKIGFYINPWLHGADSNVTAGAMACVFSSIMHKSDIRELAALSLISDHSEYAPPDKRLSEKALVLDFITSKKLRDEDSTPSSLHPKSIDAVMGDESKLDEIFRNASEKLSDALRIGIKKAKHYHSALGVKVIVLNFQHISALDYDILPGRYSTKLHDEFVKLMDEDVLLIVYYANNISIRMNKEVAGRIDILKIISDMGEKYDYIVNGGGHREAASIRVEYGQLDKALSDMLEELHAQK